MELSVVDWIRIKHALRIEQTKYEKMLKDWKPSDDESSSYQIFKKQMEETAELLKRIEEAGV